MKKLAKISASLFTILSCMVLIGTAKNSTEAYNESAVPVEEIIDCADDGSSETLTDQIVSESTESTEFSVDSVSVQGERPSFTEKESAQSKNEETVQSEEDSSSGSFLESVTLVLSILLMLSLLAAMAG